MKEKIKLEVIRMKIGYACTIVGLPFVKFKEPINRKDDCLSVNVILLMFLISFRQ